MFFISYYLFSVLSLFSIFIEAKIPCDPESFYFVKAKTVIPEVTFKVQINNAEEIGCAINATFYWEVFRYEHGSLERIKENLLGMKHKTKDKYNVLDFTRLGAHSKYVGKAFAVRVTLIPRPTHYPSYRIHYFLIAPEYIPTPTRKIFHYIGQGSLWLNATWPKIYPYDHDNIRWHCVPSFAGLESSNKYNWEIKELYLRANRTHNCSFTVTSPVDEIENTVSLVEVHILPSPTHPAIELDCIENCHNGDPFKRTVLKYTCYIQCEGIASWSVVPPDQELNSKFKYPKDQNDTLIIPPGTFDFGSTHKIAVSVQGETSNITLSFGLAEHNLTLKCMENCYFRHKPMVFQVFCDNCTGAKYNWEAMPMPSTWNRSKSDNYSPEDTLTIEPFSYLPGTDVVLSVKSKGGNATLNFTVEAIEPKLILTCLFNCDPSTVATSIDVQVKCLSDCDAITEYRWAFDPSIPKYHWYDTARDKNKTITIPTESFKPNDELTIKVFGDPYAQGAQLIIKFAPPPVLEIYCVKNCNDTTKMALSPYKPVILAVNCTGECENIIYKWSMYPKSENLERTAKDNSTQLFIPSHMYAPGDVVDFTVSGGGANATLSLQYPIPVPKLSILCLHNCFDPANPTLDTVLQAVCSELCEEVNYKWYVHAAEPFSWYDRIDTSFRNITLTIKKRSFSPNDKVTVELNSYIPFATATYDITFRVPLATLSLECLENCNNTWTHLPLSLKAKCIENCDDSSFIWDFTPIPSNFKWERNTQLTHTNSVLTLNPFIYEDGDVVTFTVKNKDAFAELEITFEEIRATLNLICRPRPCNKSQNPKSKVELEVECKKNCERDYFSWDLNPLPPHFSWDQHTIRESKNKTLVILPGTFSHNDNITATVWSGRSSALEQLVFRDPMPEIRIVCVENCNHSNPHEPVHLQVNCEWLCDYVDFYEWAFDPPITNFAYNVTLSPRHQSIVINRGVYKDGDVVNVTASWSVYNDTLRIAFVEPKPNLEIVCLRNCEYNPAKETVFEVVCTANCLVLHNYSWEITPGKHNPKFFSNNKVITLPGWSYESYDRVYLTVCQGKACNSTYVVFKFQESLLELECIENCLPGGFSNPKFETKFKVKCLEHCDVNMSYVWFLDQAPIMFNQSEDIKLDKKKEVLTIRAGLYLNETCISVNVSRGGGFAEIRVCFKEPLPVIVITCSVNCHYSDPNKQLQLTAVCTHYCANLSYSWMITPQPRDFSWERNIILDPPKKIITVLPKTFQDKETALFVVKSGNAKAERLVIFATPPPVLKLECLPTCWNVSPREKVVIRVKCIKYCDNPFYLWDVNPKPYGFIWSMNISLSNDNGTLTINEYTYENLSVVDVMVASNKSSFAMTKVHYFLPSEALKLVCKFNCKFDPKKPIIYDFDCGEPDCSKYAENLTCILVPESVLGDSIEIDDLEITVKPYRYYEETNATLYCTSRNVTIKTRIRFNNLPWNGQCFLRPNEGVSGVTVHAIDCIDFRPNATFTVFQPYPEMNKGFGVALYHGKDEFIPNILLAPMIACLTVAVGRRGNFIKISKLFASIRPFLSNDPNNNNMPTLNISQCLPMNVSKHKKKKQSNKITTRTTSTTTSRYDNEASPDFFNEFFENNNADVSVENSYNNLGKHSYFGLDPYVQNYTFDKSKRSVENEAMQLNDIGSIIADDNYTNKNDEFNRFMRWPLKKMEFEIKTQVSPEVERRQIMQLNRRMIRLDRLIRRGRVHQIVQLVFVVDQSLKASPKHICLHYRRHLLEKLIKVMVKIQPLQILTLIESMLYFHCFNLNIAHLVMEIIRNVTDVFQLRSHNSTTRIPMIRRINYIILETSGKLVDIATHLADLEDVFFADTDYPSIEQTTPYFRFITSDFLRTMELASDVLLRPLREISYDNDQISIGMFRTTTAVLDSITFSMPKVASFVEVHPYSYTTLRRKRRLLFKVMYFEPNIFWWDVAGPCSSDVLYVSGFMRKERIENGIVTVNINLQNEKKYQFAEENMKYGTLKTWKVRADINYTLEIIISGNGMKVSISNTRPSKKYTSKRGWKINEPTRLYYFVQKTPVYIGALGYGVLTLKFIEMICVSWHGEDWEWRHDDCLVGIQNSDKFVKCHCSRMSLFSAFAMPADIEDLFDLETPFRELVDKSHIFGAALFVTSVTFLVLFLIAYFKDREHSKKFKVNVLKDNNYTDSERYLIVVQTGLWPNSGTTARVAIQVIGSKFSSDVHLLNVRRRRTLQRNNTDFFVMFTPTCLGRLRFIQLWHDLHGSSPSWFCDAIVIRHLPKGKRYLFLVSRWFSLSKQPGTVQGRFRAKRKRVDPQFQVRLESVIRAHHTFFGLFFNRYHITKLKSQVLVFCVSVLSMMTAAAVVIWKEPMTWENWYKNLIVVLIFGLIPSAVIDFLLRRSR